MEDRCLLSGGIAEYQTPPQLGGPSSLAVGQDGSIWFTEYFGGTIGRFFPSDERFVRYTIPTPNSNPLSITPDSHGNMWFTESSGNKIGKITATGVVEREYPLPLPNCGPHSITEGPDGKLWFTTERCHSVMALSPSTGRIDPYFIFANSVPLGIAVGQDGNLWFADGGRSTMGTITVGGILLPEIPLPVGGGPYNLTTGVDGKVWYTRFSRGLDRVGTITPDRLFVREFLVRPGCNPHSIASRHDGTQWVACIDSSSVLRLDSEGAIIGEFTLPTPNVQPNAITTDQAGNIWVSELLPSRIAKIFEYPIVAEGTYQTGTVGEPVAGVVATFADSDPSEHSEHFYSAWIDWGDGSVTEGLIQPNGPRTFTVGGFHTYEWEGLFEISVWISDFSPFFTPAAALGYADIGGGGSFPGGAHGGWTQLGWIDLDLLLDWSKKIR